MLSRKDHIKAYAETFASNMFAIMLNPKNRGENLKFSPFSLGELAVSSANMHFVKPLSKKEESTLLDIAKNKWDRYVQDSGVEGWIANSKTPV